MVGLLCLAVTPPEGTVPSIAALLGGWGGGSFAARLATCLDKRRSINQMKKKNRATRVAKQRRGKKTGELRARAWATHAAVGDRGGGAH